MGNTMKLYKLANFKHSKLVKKRGILSVLAFILHYGSGGFSRRGAAQWVSLACLP